MDRLVAKAIDINSVFDANEEQSIVYIDGNVCIFTFNISLNFFSI